MYELFDTQRVKIIETIILILVLVVVKIITTKAIKRILNNLDFDLQRKKLSQKIVNIFIIMGVTIGLAGIWNIDQKEMMVFFTSILTILGIAFFAQWSILSNITASLILFFNHPLRIGQYIQVLDKEFSVEGKLEDISFFFLHIRTLENEIITIPNNVVLQRTLLIKSNSTEEVIKKEVKRKNE